MPIVHATEISPNLSGYNWCRKTRAGCKLACTWPDKQQAIREYFLFVGKRERKTGELLHERELIVKQRETYRLELSLAIEG